MIIRIDQTYAHHRCDICERATARGVVGYGDCEKESHLALPTGWVEHEYPDGPGPDGRYLRLTHRYGGVITGAACPACADKAVSWAAAKSIAVALRTRVAKGTP